MKPAKFPLYAVALALLAATFVPAQAQTALTPAQLTLRVERLTELSQRSEAKLGTIQEQLAKLSEDMNRMGRLIDNRAMLDMIQLVDQLSEEISLLNGKMLIEIKDNKLRVKKSECPRQVCVHMGWIRFTGETIICVPYKTLIEIKSTGAPSLDAVAF